jgi:hypothetical protein
MMMNEGISMINKYFSIIFWSMLLVAGVLSIMTANNIENKLKNIERNMDSIQYMLDEMTDDMTNAEK